MNDDHLSKVLKSLPREQASLGFTAGVLRRIEAAPPWWRSPFVALRESLARWFPAATTPRWTMARWSVTRWTATRWTAVTAAAALILAVGLGWREWRHHQKAEHLQLLLVEKQELEAELEALRRLTEEARPTVYLGGHDQVDVVLDLARFKRQGGFGSKSRAANPTPSENRSAVATVGTSPSRNRAASLEESTVRPLRVVY